MKAGLDPVHIHNGEKKTLNDYLCQKSQCKKPNWCKCVEEFEEKNEHGGYKMIPLKIRRLLITLNKLIEML